MLLEAGESETVEFKSSFTRETIETLVAFANTSGGNHEGVTQLLQCIVANPGIRTPGLANMLHVSPKTLERWIKTA